MLALLEELGREVSPERVLLMPEAVEADMLQRRAESVVEICKQHGFRFCNRLHIQLWGNTKGR